MMISRRDSLWSAVTGAWLTAALAVMLAGFETALAVEVGGGEWSFTPRLFVGSVSWSQLRQQGGHKAMAGLEGLLDYRLDNWVVGVMGQKWWVTEGMDSNMGIMPEEGHRLGLEVRRLFDVGDGFSLYPFVSLGYEEWWRHELHPQVWSKLGFLNGVLGLGLEHQRAYLKAGIGHAFAARANQGGNPEGRFGFESEAGVRLAAWTVGLFWRGAGFQAPDAKLLQAGAFLGYTF